MKSPVCPYVFDAYICFDCFGKIFPRGEKPEPTEWMQIIYTNMGHKR